LQGFVASSQSVVALLGFVLTGFILYEVCSIETHLMMLSGDELLLHVGCLRTSHVMTFN
jgi:hypothetical protein